MISVVLLYLLPLVVGTPGERQSPIPDGMPFAVGEHLRYSVKMGMLRVGTGTMSIVGTDSLRGVASYHFVFTLEGGIPGYRINDRFESWTGREDMVSRRFYKDIREGGSRHSATFEIFPDSGHYLKNGAEPRPTPPDPLDDASFFYFIRTVPLEVGKTYSFDRYYDAAMNPMTIRVEKRENIKLPDGTKVPTLVLHPVMGEHGMLARRAKAKVWLTDDERRLPVRIRSKLPFGTLTLKLESASTLPDADADTHAP